MRNRLFLEKHFEIETRLRDEERSHVILNIRDSWSIFFTHNAFRIFP